MAVGDPTGDDLCSGTTNGNTLLTTYAEREITIDTPVELTSGVKYAIVVRCTGPNIVIWNYQLGNPYANGAAQLSTNSGEAWGAATSWDAWFSTKVGGVVKDSYNFVDTTRGINTYAANWTSQSFTATSTYTISSIVLILKRSGATPGTITVSIKATVGAPVKATTPAPANAASDVTLDQATLTWVDGGGATSYDVYYGDTSGDLTLVSSGQAGLSFTVNGITLGSPYAYATTRYWRIDSVNAAGTTTGDEWSFTTINFDCLRISYVLITGGSGSGPYDTPPGVEGTDWRFTGENNLMTVRKLVACANNKFWYEV